MTVAIVLPDTLSAVGLQHLLLTYCDISSCCFDSCESFLASQPEQYDGYFINPDNFVVAMELLLPRRQRVVLVTNRDYKQWNGMVLHIDRSVEDVVEQLADAIRSIKTNNDMSELQEDLSSREIDVLRCVAQGMINKEIADYLHISVNTVLTHRKNIVAKLGIKTVSGLSLYAVMNGLIEIK